MAKQFAGILLVANGIALSFFGFCLANANQDGRWAFGGIVSGLMFAGIGYSLLTED